MASKTIRLKNYLNIFEENTATAVAINPGMFLERTSAGLVQAHSVAGGNVVPLVALEDELQGNDIDDAYAVSAKINCWIPTRGDEVYAWLKIGGTAVVIGDRVESAAGGLVQKYVADAADSDSPITVYPLQIIGEVLEAADPAAATVRVKIKMV